MRMIYMFEYIYQRKRNQQYKRFTISQKKLVVVTVCKITLML